MKPPNPTPLHLVSSHDLPRGIQAVRGLPDPELATLWDSIVVEGGVKERLLAQAVLNYTLRPKIDRSTLPLHGVILLVGPPGTGKTSLARGLASTVASLLKGSAFRLVEVDPHALTSSAMGRTQRAVGELFSQSITEQAASGPTIVLLDEVETLAADRSRMSLEANPIDIHRATDAVLVQLDTLASSHPQLLFVATSNFPQAIDSAFTSRCDLVVKVPPPGPQAAQQILHQCLTALGETFPAIARLAESKAILERLGKAAAGLDGRSLRKLVVNALAMRKESAMDPNKLAFADLISAAELAQQGRAAGNGGRQ